jgi:hypothetical protein
MTCVPFRMGGVCGILTLADESEPFLCGGKWYVVNKQFGPIATNKQGDPLTNQPSGRKLQAAYDQWKRLQSGVSNEQLSALKEG